MKRNVLLLSELRHVWPQRTLLKFILWSLPCLSSMGAEGVLQVGERAPSFTLNNPQGKPFRMEETSGTILLVFVKTHDRNTTTALAQLKHLLQQEPILEKQIQCRIIVTRLMKDQKLPEWLSESSAPWQVLLDPRDQTYRDYHIIATPTYVILAPDHTVLAAHPGYDSGMTQHLRLELARSLKLDLPSAARGEKPERPDMNLQLARQLTERRLWDQALTFYQKVAAQKQLSPVDQLAVARIYLEIDQPDEALRLLDMLTTATNQAEMVGQLRRQALSHKSGQRGLRPAPAVR